MKRRPPLRRTVAKLRRSPGHRPAPVCQRRTQCTAVTRRDSGGLSYRGIIPPVTATANGYGNYATAFGSSATIPISRHTSTYVVIKYL